MSIYRKEAACLNDTKGYDSPSVVTRGKEEKKNKGIEEEREERKGGRRRV
jgi:hypothetical protein